MQIIVNSLAILSCLAWQIYGFSFASVGTFRTVSTTARCFLMIATLFSIINHFLAEKVPVR